MLEHILEVRIDEEIFGIDSEKIFHILKVPPITPIPVTNLAVKGVSVILGKIVTIVDIASILGLKGVNVTTESSKILTISDDTALLVDEVLEMIDIKDNNFEEVEDSFIKGFYRLEDRIVQIIDIEKILSQLPPKQFKPQHIEKISNRVEKSGNSKEEEFKRYLFFYIDNEEFAIDISLVKEIIFVPNITPVTEKEDRGLIDLRGEIIPLLDINKIFDFDEVEISSQSRVIIISDNKHSIGLLVQKVEEVKDIAKKEVEEFKSEKISGVYKGDDRIASIISNNFILKLIEKYSLLDESSENNYLENRGFKMIEVVVFKIADEEFAFNIDDVQEIIKYEKPIFFPQAPKFVKGLLNLRGSVIPIISLPNKLGFEEKKDDKSKIIVCNIREEKVGFIVDDVSDILFVEDNSISEIENPDSIFDEVINLDDRVILKIDIDKIFSDEEIEKIKLSRLKKDV